MLVQQQTGGNLAEMLDKLATIIRQRFHIRGKIKTLTAEGRIQAAVLLGLPPALLVIMLLMNRSYGQVLFQYPALLVGMFGCIVGRHAGSVVGLVADSHRPKG